MKANSTSSSYSLSSDPNTFESVVFRMKDDFHYNFDKHDPLIDDFVLIHSPVKFLILISGILLLLKVTEKLMEHRAAPSFARPAFLVNCGLTFGINGVGALICLAGKGLRQAKLLTRVIQRVNFLIDSHELLTLFLNFINLCVSFILLL
jgi:hypothetical protein